MGSKRLQAVDGQQALALSQPHSIAEEVIFTQPSFSAAIRLGCSVSGLDEKQIYRELEIDAGHWTRIMNGEAHFPVDKLLRLMDLVGNEIPLQWLAHRRGKGLVLLESEAERLLRQERERAERAEAENRLLRDLVQGRAA